MFQLDFQMLFANNGRGSLLGVVVFEPGTFFVGIPNGMGSPRGRLAVTKERSISVSFGRTGGP